MPKRFVWIAAIVCLAGMILLTPLARSGQAQNLSAAFFVAHVGTHEDASVVPIPAVGGHPTAFEVRVREAGTSAKAAWQVRVILDACRFETPTAADVHFGDYMAAYAPIPVGPKIALVGNRILIDVGQLLISDAETAAAGLLATITALPKPRVACPDANVAPPEQATADLTYPVLAAPGGVTYDVTTFAGRFAYAPAPSRKVLLPFVSRVGGSK